MYYHAFKYGKMCANVSVTLMPARENGYKGVHL